MKRARFGIEAMVVGLALVVSAPGASAAPQVLALLATGAPVSMPCFAGECAVELGAFCLQKGRDIPDRGARYRAEGDAFRLIVVGADGRARRLPAAAHVAVVAVRGQTAVRVTLAKRTLADLGGVRVAVEVGDGVSLVPEPVAGDPSPQSAEEIATATGPLRALGSAIVDHAGAEAVSARIAVQAINALPESGRIPRERAFGAWRAAERTVGADELGVAAGRALFRHCRTEVEIGHVFSMRRCLERAHDGVLRALNLRYWQTIVGS